MENRIYALLMVGFTVFLLTLTRCNTSTTNVYPLTQVWEFAVPYQELPEGIASLSASYCGACHQPHYDEWKLSTHAHAWVDLQFQAELKKETSPFMCINCHIPLQNQQEEIVTGLIDGDIYQPVKTKNPKFDYDLQQEGINCAACHVRDNTIIGPTGTSKAPHAVRKDTVHLSEQLCINCHNAVAVITPTLACTFETGDEWKAGPYYGKKNCKSCHMEELNREIVAGYGERKSHLHYFAGSGIPKFDTVQTKMLNGLAFYPTLESKTYTTGDSLLYQLRIKNEFAGHKVPTGDPERFIIFSFALANEKGTIIAEQTERIGEDWEWHPVAKKLGDNNLLPGEERTYFFQPKLVEKGNYQLAIEVIKHRMGEKAAEYNKLDHRYPREVSIYKKTYRVQVVDGGGM